jgi:hypothetical protein
MSTTTTSNYISQIDQTFPIAGQDNDSQGFRSNFINIVGALTSANGDISDLSLNSVKVNQTNDFGYNTIERAIFQNCGVSVYDNSATPVSGSLVIDYSAGSYQKYSLNSGTTTISVINLPGNLKSGNLILSVSTATTYDTFINFGATNLYNLNSQVLPMKIVGTAPTVFDIQSDGTSGNLYVKRINEIFVGSANQVIYKDSGNNAASSSNLTFDGNNLAVSGNINAGGTIRAFASSDSKLKTKIEIITDALNKLSELDGITFNWNELATDQDHEIREAGVIAQQVQEVLPEVVKTRNDGYLGVRYEGMIPLLIQAIKELNQKVVDLETKLNSKGE